MERTGHEGYPVVQEDRIVGLLTRQAVERAKRHRLEQRQVADVMDAGEAWVAPGDPVEKVQSLMAEHGWGQMPVVEDGKVTGIVTRTDLIKLWSTPAKPSSIEEEIGILLGHALSPETLALVHRISHTAAQMGYSIYFVGGLVRDLLLDLPIVDIDIVVEGDAIALARQLRYAYGGRVRSHGRFGTAKWLIENASARGLLAELFATSDEIEQPDNSGDLPASIDFVTARTEFYTHPTALPEVERSSIKQDLHRRDFTINTLAIQLDPDQFGKLLDFYGGESDLRQGMIRVLHSLSFIEDPTRILRAARLEARLDFKIELRTEQLIADAVPMLDRVSGDRIRHELVFIFRETEPERALCRLQELGVLEAISPGLACDPWLQARFQRLRQASSDDVWPRDEETRVFAHLALMLYRLSPQQRRQCQKRLRLGREDVKGLGEVASIRARVPQLEQIQAASALFNTLEPFSAAALLVVWAAEKEAVRHQIRRFQEELRDVRTLLDGRYIIERYGLRPSPLFGHLLDRLRDARLDGQVETREDEEAMLAHLLDAIKDEGGVKAWVEHRYGKRS
jgi:tRNA nucleotidyltransferase (CCA-adding enzyme)